jgi:molybdopterin-binding protein
MPIFNAKVTAVVPGYVEATVSVEAGSKEVAEAKIREMYNNDELSFDTPNHDYDSAKIESIEWQ